MGHESIVYGAIVGARWKLHDPRRVQRLNQQLIATLPETDDWPFLTRPMFALAGESFQAGQYRSQLIHFGATFKAIEWEWEAWLAKFEPLLMQLFWDSVHLHLRTETVGNYDYEYRALQTSQRFYEHEPPLPVAAWRFSGGPRTFEFDGPAVAEAAEQVWMFADGVWTTEP